MAIKKKNKFVIPQEYNQSVIFAKGGRLFNNYYDGTSTETSQLTTGGGNNNGNNNSNGKFNATAAIGPTMGAVNQISDNLGIWGGKDNAKNQIPDINGLTRSDVLGNVHVDSGAKDVWQAGFAGMGVGAEGGSSIMPGWGTLIGGAGGLVTGIGTALIGNGTKEKAAKEAEAAWTNNLEAKDRQFQQQDLRQNMANFSANGGDLFAYGGNIKGNNPLTEFNSGQSHEQNPNGGVMQGTGANGKPNLVEEGETKHEDYIFSDRLKVNPTITKQFKLPAGLNGKTFAAASKYLNKEAKERPNDPISNNAVKAQLAKLTAAQEGLKQQMQSQQPQQQQGIPMQGQQPTQQNPMQAQQLQQPQEQPQGNIMEDGSQQFKFGGYKPKKPLRADNKMEMLMSSVQKMMAQGMSQEDIEMQLQKSGVNADQAEQIVMSAMQQMKGQQAQQQQPQQHGIPMGGQQMANGGYVDQTHYQNPTLQGANIDANGGYVDNFWGIKDGKYTQEFKDSVEKLYNDSVKSTQAVNALKKTGYVKSKEDLLKYTNDFKIGPVHDYMKQNIQQPKPRLDYNGDWPDPQHNSYLRPTKLSEVQKARETNPNAFKGFEAIEPTGTTFANGGNIYGGPYITPNASNYIQTQNSGGDFGMYSNNNFQMYPNAKHDFTDVIDNTNNIDINNNNQYTDYSRYAPVAANIAMGISDMFQKPEVVKYNRMNPERNTAHMDYTPIDTEWMNNKMNATYAGTRDQIINNAGGNRAMVMAGLSGINQQQQNAVGEAYLKVQDINYGRKQQATQFNAGIEGQNVAARNAAQQQNLQLQMAELDANARNRAAKRNAARQAILNAAGNIGDIGRENFNANTIKSSTGYKYNQDGSLNKDVKEGTISKSDNTIYRNGQWVKYQ